jgi:arylsulfatase A-like enzyme
MLICVDQWPGRLLGAAGHPTIMTPTLDQLAANGVRYAEAYSSVPVCIAARRALLTGTTAKTHGDRGFNETLAMPDVPTVASVFRGAGYQTYAVGKMHVHPQRARLGFDDIILNEEGRHQFGMSADDYELFLADQGYPGHLFAHGMGNNDYLARAWHLPEYLHPTYWTTREMCRMIKRRDPLRPAFWYLSYNFPHPPLAPPRDYLDMYRQINICEPILAEWSEDLANLPYALKKRSDHRQPLNQTELRKARQAFFAQCTYIDHQMRLVIGSLREEGLLDNTILCFVADHGDMLGNHNLYEKRVFYEDSAKVPFILVPTAHDDLTGHHQVDDRLVELRDIMPTLLHLADIPVPGTVEGISVVSETRREYLYGEWGEGDLATRMVRDNRHKLIYYPVGNRMQLFDLSADPDERNNLMGEASVSQVQAQLTQELIRNIYGDDLEWIVDGELVGLPDQNYEPAPNRGLNLQRGWHFV